MRILCVILVCCYILVCCSGCGVILGGIIGYQSGELLAGAAIGAGVQYGGAAVEGISQILANPVEDIKKANIDLQKGEIELPRAAFTPSRLRCLSGHLQDVFKENNWKLRIELKNSGGSIEYKEKWACTTSDGHSFDLMILRQRGKLPTITICSTDEDKGRMKEVTSEVFEWLNEVVNQKKC